MIADANSLNHRSLYRLPWSPTDNIISWLEPTKNCNIHCHGCYSANVTGSHKSLETIEHELDVFERFRQTDAVSIAGGEPLTHPNIVDIVRRVAARGLKPVINTNGYAMTPELMRDLKRAGARGFTFHIDSLQKRPGYTGQSESQLNDLRLRYAEMAAKEGDLSCAFNATVYGANLKEVPAIVEWGREHIDIAHVLVFIAFRALTGDLRFDYYVGEKRIDEHRLVYSKPTVERTDISARDIVAAIRTADPDFAPCAYLNGSESLDSFKWLMTLRVGDRQAHRRACRAEVHRTGAGLEPPASRPLPGLHPAARAPARALDVRALAVRQWNARRDGEGPRRGAHRSDAPGAPPAPAVDHDHPAGRPPSGRPPVDVRQLPRHDRPRGPARLLVPAGREAAVRAADEDGADDGEVPGGAARGRSRPYGGRNLGLTDSVRSRPIRASPGPRAGEAFFWSPRKDSQSCESVVK